MTSTAKPIRSIRCTKINGETNSRLFIPGKCYQVADGEPTLSVIDELGRLRCIGDKMRFVVDYHSSPMSPLIESPVTAFFEPAH